MKYDFEKIGHRIEDIRKKNGINSADELAFKLKEKYGKAPDRKTIRRIEQGDNSKMSFQTIVRIADILCVDMGYLLGENEQYKKIDDKAIGDTLQLSQESIDTIKIINSRPEYAASMNLILNCKGFQKFVAMVTMLKAFCGGDDRLFPKNKKTNDLFDLADKKDADLTRAISLQIFDCLNELRQEILTKIERSKKCK